MNPAALLALISDLYTQIVTLKQENETLQNIITTLTTPTETEK